MTAKLADILASLVAIIADETAQLRSAAPFAARSELAAAKARLVALLEMQVMDLRRDDGAALRDLAVEDRQSLAELFEALIAAATENADALRRQIDLSTEMMAVIVAEAQRLSGARASAYSALGEIWTSDGRAPISLNARL